MRIVTNEELVKRNKRTATYLFFFSLIVLVGGFFLANGQLLGLAGLDELGGGLYLAVMPLVLLVGFTTTLISVRMTNLWIRQPRPEEAIEGGLKGLSNKSVLYNYYHMPSRHVLIAPQGIFAIITRFQDGKFSVDEGRWRSHKSAIGRLLSFFRLDGIGNPSEEAKIAADYIQHIIEDYDEDLEVQPIVLFVDPRAELEVGETTVPVVHADPKKSPNLKNFLRDYREENGDMFTNEELTAFVQEFEYATLE